VYSHRITQLKIDIIKLKDRPYFKSSFIATLTLFSFLLSQASCSIPTATNPDITIAAASSLSPAFKVIGDRFTAQSGISINFSFAATGTLKEQIVNGAPFDIFATANTASLDDLIERGFIYPESRVVFACGEIIIVVNPLSSYSVEKLNDLANPVVRRIALANPEIAPYGAAAKQALKSALIWDIVKDRIVYGENVRQALQFVETGDVRFGIVPLSLLSDNNLITVDIPSSYYSPIEHLIGINVLTNQKKLAGDFIDYLIGPEGQNLLSHHNLQLESCER
jgi:molybdate transport system substrate-binding protein